MNEKMSRRKVIAGALAGAVVGGATGDVLAQGISEGGMDLARNTAHRISRRDELVTLYKSGTISEEKRREVQGSIERLYENALAFA